MNESESEDSPVLSSNGIMTIPDYCKHETLMFERLRWVGAIFACEDLHNKHFDECARE